MYCAHLFIFVLKFSFAVINVYYFYGFVPRVILKENVHRRVQLSCLVINDLPRSICWPNSIEIYGKRLKLQQERRWLIFFPDTKYIWSCREKGSCELVRQCVSR